MTFFNLSISWSFFSRSSFSCSVRGSWEVWWESVRLRDKLHWPPWSYQQSLKGRFAKMIFYTKQICSRPYRFMLCWSRDLGVSAVRKLLPSFFLLYDFANVILKLVKELVFWRCGQFGLLESGFSILIIKITHTHTQPTQFALVHVISPPVHYIHPYITGFKTLDRSTASQTPNTTVMPYLTSFSCFLLSWSVKENRGF